MTAVITGTGLGLERSSTSLLGSSGTLGAAGLGAANNAVFVNAANGNLVVQATDQILIGLGVSDVVARTYNSLGQFSGNNGALWSDAASRHVDLSSLTGTVNTVGSTINRLAADGSVTIYTYSSAAGGYVANEGGGAYDTLTFSAGADQWTWTDGATQTTEVYDGAHAGRIVSATDSTGANAETYGYSAAGLLTTVTTANGETTNLSYNADNEIESIQTTLSGGATATQVYYGYDGSGRLTSTTIDLSPGDNSTSDGNVYVTQYAYNGSSNQLSSITQSDGSQLQINYNTSGQVSSVVQLVSSGSSNSTSFSYGSGSTTVTDANDDVDTLEFDAAGDLTSLVTPQSQTSLFSYDAMGNVLTATQPNGATTTYSYDGNGNRISAVDSLGDTQVWTYSSSNLLLSATHYAAPALAGAQASQPLTTRYIYSTDGQDDLLYTLSPTNEVTQYVYGGAPGEVTSILQYPASSLSPPLAGDLTTHVAATGATAITLPLLGGAPDELDIVTDAAHGTVTISGTTLTYTPDTGYSGVDSFQYSATNAYGTSETATVTVDTGAQASVSSYSLAQFQAWTGAAWDKSGVVRTDQTFDARGQLSSITNYATIATTGAAGTTASRTYYAYSPSGQLLSQQSSGFNNSALNTYDGLGRVTSRVDANGATTIYAYANNTVGSSITATNSANGLVQVSSYNLAGQLTSTTDSTYSGASTSYAYDSLGQLRMVTDPTGVSTYFIYDNDGRKVADIAAGGSITTYAYNADAQVNETIQYAEKLSPSQLALLDASGTPDPVTLSDVLPSASAADQISYTIYDASNRLAETIDGSGVAVIYQYDGASRLTSKTSYASPISAGDLASYRTSPPTTVVSPAAEPDQDQVTTYSYDDDGNLVQATVDPGGLGFSTTSTYDAFGNLTATTDPNGDVTRYVYDNANRLVYEISSGGVVTQTTYNGQNAVASTRIYTAAVASETLSTWPLSVDLASVADAISTSSTDRLTDYVYDSSGRLTETIVDPYNQNLLTTNTYDAVGELIAVTAPTGQVLRYAYNSDGQRIFAVDGTGGVTSTTYAANGQITATDAFATSLSATDLSALSPTAMAALSPSNLVAAIEADLTTTAADRTMHDIYNDDGQLAYVIDGSGDVTGYDYDAFGHIVQATLYGEPVAPTSYTFAAIQTLVSSQVGSDDNSVTRTVYNLAGEPAYTIDADGQVTATSYDAFGHVVQQIRYATAFSASGFETLSTMQSWAADNSSNADRTSRYVYDDAGREVFTIDPSGDVTGTTYDANGRPVAVIAYAAPLTSGQLAALPTITSADDVTDVLATSAADRISRAIYNADGQLAYGVDADGNVTAYTYDTFGDIVSAQVYATPLSAETAASLPLQVAAEAIATDLVASTSDQISHDIYNSAGELAYSIDALGRVTEYDYDSLGRPVQTIVYASPVTPTGYAFSAIQSLVAGQNGAAGNRVTRTVYNNAGEAAYSIDAAGDVTAFAFDAFGNVVRQTQYATTFNTSGVQSLSGMTGWAASVASSSDRTSLFVYDAAGRQIYTIDAAGDVTQKSYDAKGLVVATQAFATALTAIQLEELSAIPTASEIVGVVAASADDEINRYVYDPAGRLLYAIDALGGVVQNTYDANGALVAARRYATPLTSGIRSSLPLEVMAEALAADLTPSSADQTTRYAYDTDGRLTYTVDALGNVKASTYNAFGQVLSTTAYATALTAGQLSGLPIAASAATIAAEVSSSASDQINHYTYDADGRVLTSIDPMGGETTNTYDAFGNVATVTDPRGETGYFYYDALNRQILQIDPNGYATATSYSLGNQVTAVQRYKAVATGTGSPSVMPTLDATAGVETTLIGRDALDRVTSNTDATGATETYTLDTFGDRIFVTNQVGGVTTNTYDTRGFLLSETLPETSAQAAGSVTSPSVSTEATSVTNRYTYDAFGNRISQVEAAGLAEQRTTIYSYDALNRQTAQYSDAVTATTVDMSTGLISTNTVTPTEFSNYDIFGNLLESIDADGNQTFYYYDARNRKIAQVDPDGTLSAWTYDAYNNVETAKIYGDAVPMPSATGGSPPSPVDADNYRETDYTYDRNNRQTKVSVEGALVGQFVDGIYQSATTAITTQTVYDASGNTIQTVDGDGNSTYYYYDAAGRKIAEVDADNYLTTYALDSEGNVLTEDQYAAPVGATVSPTTSLATVLASAIAGDTDRVTEFSYDNDGRRLTETRENVDASSLASLGQLTTAPANSTITYTYNGLGEVTRETQATGDFTAYTYDLSGRTTATTTTSYVSYAGPTVQPTTLYYYDGLNNLTMTALGTVGAALNNDHVTQYVYGAGGRLMSMTDATGFAQNFAYDADGQLVVRTYNRAQSNGASVAEAQAYNLDTMGRTVAQATGDLNGSTWTFGAINQLTYDAYGEVTSQGVNGGAQQTYTYDGAGREIGTDANGGSQSFFANDADGLQTLEIDSTGSNLTGDSISTAMALVLDGDGAPVNASGATATFKVYDGRGALTQTVQPFRQLTTGTTATLTDTKAYDAFGDVVQDTNAAGAVTQYSFDALGDLTQQVDPSVASTSASGVTTNVNPTYNYFFDISGRRVGSEDADGNITSEALLAGTGYNGSSGVVLNQYNPDGSGMTNGVDVYGNIVASSDALGDTTTFAYDAMNRLISQTTGVTAPVKLYGTSGQDTLNGGTYEQGNGGGDTYIYQEGYGSLEIFENSGGAPEAILQMGAGITASSINVFGDTNGDLFITDGVAGDQIKIDHEVGTFWDIPGDAGIMEVAFADGSSLTREQLVEIAATGSTLNNESVYGSEGADTLDSKGYAVYDQGDGGSDTFVYDSGYGQLEVNEDDGYPNASTAVLQLGAGITAADLTVTNDGSNNMLVTDGVTGDQIKVDQQFATGAWGVRETGVGEIEFADGSVLTRQQLDELAATGSPVNTKIYGTSGSDTLDSNGYATYAQGDAGPDTYVYDADYGHLEINADNGYFTDANSILELGAGIAASDLTISNDGSGNMIISDGNAGDRIQVDGEFNTGAFGMHEYGLSEIDFADGSSLTRDQMIAAQTTGSALNKKLYGTTGAETFDSNGYASYILGGGGADTFAYAAGYGALEIDDNNGNFSAAVATLNFETGISASDLTVTNDGNGDMLISDGTPGDQIKVDGEFSSGGYGYPQFGVATVNFADGSSLTRQQLIAMTTSGSAVNTKLYGTGDAETFAGNGEAHYAQGGGGVDLFTYQVGDANFEINEDAGRGATAVAVLQLGTGISQSSLTVTNDGYGDIIINDGVVGDRIQLDGEIYYTESGVGEVDLSDGTVLTRQDLLDMAAAPTPSTTSYTGTSAADTFDEEGPAYEQGNGGADTFIYDQGYGHLEISEDAGFNVVSTAVLQLGPHIDKASVAASIDSAGNILLTDAATGDSIKLDGAGNPSFGSLTEYGVAEVQFSDGSSLTRAQLLALAVKGSPGVESLYGTGGADDFDSKGDAQYIQGNGGADTFAYDQHYGQLEISDESAWGTATAAVLNFGAGITASSLSVSSDSRGDLILSDGTAGDQIKIDAELTLDGPGATAFGVAQINFADGSALTRQQLIDLADTGAAANTNLYGTSGADTFNSNGEARYIQGNGGADSFVYDEGYGTLEISDEASWGTNSAAVLTMGVGVTAAGLTVTSDSRGDIIIADGIAGDQLTLDYEATNDGAGGKAFGVSEIEFADGSSLTRQQLIALATTGSYANPNLYGSPGADTFQGSGYAHYEQGDGGADAFVYNQGEGALEISEDAGLNVASTAVLKLGAGITAASINVASDSAGDLIITDGTTGDRIQIDGGLALGYNNQPEDGVAEIDFADGSSLTRNQLLNIALTGSPINTRLYGSGGADTFDSQGYARYAQGNGGADTFIYDQGYGPLEINEDAGFDVTSTAVLQLGAGITDGSFAITKDSAGDILLTDAATGDSIKLDGEANLGWGNHAEYGVAEVQFSNGFTLTRDQLVSFATPQGSLTTYYTYDGLGQRLSVANSQLGAGVTSTTDYDALGRVVQTTDYDGHTTNYAYTYDPDMATAGLGTFGGWVVTQTNSTGLTSTTDQDYFGRSVGRTDFGGDVYADTFDAAGRLITETMTNAADVLATTTTNTYYNTSNLAGSTVDYGWATNGIVSTASTYTYDVEGNRLAETYSGSTGGASPTVTSYEDAASTYDAMNRVVSYTDTGQGGDEPIAINYYYDDNSNVRRMTTSSVFAPGDGAITQDFWYAYDGMNRFVTTDGTLLDGAIVRGTTGTDLTYNRAGERATETTTTVETAGAGGGYVSWNDDHVESFTYSPSGYLLTTSLSDGTYNATTGTVTQAPAYLAAVDVRDAMGRVVDYVEYTVGGSIYYSSASTYDGDSEVLTQVQDTAQADGSTLVNGTSYDYDAAGTGGYNGAYEGGNVTHSDELFYTIGTDGTVSPQTTSNTINTYTWTDTALETGISYVSSQYPDTTQTSTFNYDAANHVSSVDVNDGTPETVGYVTNTAGEIMSRVVSSGADVNPQSNYYFFDGQQVGEVTNDGFAQASDYAQAISARSSQANNGPFTDGSDTPINYIGLGDAYQPITPTSQGSSTQSDASYTVRSGDTLSSIAQAQWGDSSLWYLIADANGLSGNANLTVGTTLLIPSKVVNVHNNSSTFAVYNPTQALGNVQPLNPPPASGGGGCGIFGEILEVIVAAVVAVVASLTVQPELAAGAASLFEAAGASADAAGVAGTVAAAATVGASASVISQGVGIAVGAQNGFNWTSVGLAALSAGVNGGLVKYGGLLAGGLPLAQVGRALVSNLATQGVELASGLEHKFSWPGVATSAIEAGVMSGGLEIADRAVDVTPNTSSLAGFQPVTYVAEGLTGIAAAIAGGAARSLLTDDDFGQSIQAELPNTIGQTIGNAIAGNIQQQLLAQGSQGTSGNDERSDGTIQTIQIVDQPSVQAMAPIYGPGDLDTTLPEISFAPFDGGSGYGSGGSYAPTASGVVVTAPHSTPSLNADNLDDLSATPQLLDGAGETISESHNEIVVTAPRNYYSYDATFGATEGLSSYITQNALRSAQVRQQYISAASQLEPTDQTGRSALKALTRAATPAPERAIIEALRPGLGPTLGSVGGAARTNAAVNAFAKGLGYAGKASAAITVATGGIEIATANDKLQATSAVAGSVIGGTGGGVVGSEIGGAIGLVGGPFAEITVPAGAVVGGFVGSMYFGSKGHAAGALVYNLTTGR